MVVELKAVDALATIHSVQLRSYLKAMGQSLGLLINFNVPLLHHGLRRVVVGGRKRNDAKPEEPEESEKDPVRIRTPDPD